MDYTKITSKVDAQKVMNCFHSTLLREDNKQLDIHFAEIKKNILKIEQYRWW